MDNIYGYEKLYGSKIIRIKRTLNLIMFCFETTNNKKVFIHAQCYIRLFEVNELVLSSDTMYTPSRNIKKRLFKKFKWSNPGQTLFDDIVKEYEPKLMSANVKEITANNKDMKIIFSNNLILEILAVVTKSDDISYSENYRIFDEDKDKSHYIV